MAELTNSRDLWEYLVSEGGLQPRSWDRALVKNLRDRLGLPESGAMEDRLEEADIDIEPLVYSLFAALEPFAEMLSDLLALLERHNITSSDHVAEIRFDFDAPGEPLSFDLDSFRTTRSKWFKALLLVPVVDWPRYAWWDLVEAVQGWADVPLVRLAQPALADWSSRYEAGEWPGVLDPPTCGVAALDSELVRVWAVWRGWLAAVAVAALDLDALRARSHQLSTGQIDPEESALQLLAYLEMRGEWHDRWPRALAYAVFGVAEWIRSLPPGQREREAALVARRLKEFFEANPLRYESSEGLVERLLDVLELPVWKRRHELYAAWIFAELVAAMPRDAQLLPSEQGVLRFPFKSTLMASVPSCDPPLEIWSELRSPLSDPLGVSRTTSVQPDYSVLLKGAAGKASFESSLVEVEVKQYQKPSNKVFAAALRDYAKARPRARVLLVDHGRVNETTVRRQVEAPYRSRTRVVSELHPLNESARAAFRDLVRDAVAHVCTAPREERSTDDSLRGLVAVEILDECEVAWSRGPSDLDLHLRIQSPAGTRHVWYGSEGDLWEYPYADLIFETNGRQVLGIAEWLDARYDFAVHNFSNDAPLAGCGAEAKIPVHVPVRADSIRLRCPDSGTGRWWLLATIAPNGALEVLNEIVEDWGS
jgi:hypothetical protein